MPETTPPPVRSLARKLSEVMGQVGRIPKTGFNEHFRYKFVRESELVEKISELLSERQVCITSRVTAIETFELSKVLPRTGEVVVTKTGVLRIEYTFHDGESGETLTTEGVGEIDQDGGKGLYKAQTGAMKYMLMKNFLVATGDDPEDDHGKGPPAKAPARSSTPKTVTGKPAGATEAQLAEIDKLCKQLGKDPQKDVLAPMGIATPTMDQAKDLLKKLRDRVAQQELEATPDPKA